MQMLNVHDIHPEVTILVEAQQLSCFYSRLQSPDTRHLLRREHAHLAASAGRHVQLVSRSQHCLGDQQGKGQRPGRNPTP